MFELNWTSIKYSVPNYEPLNLSSVFPELHFFRPEWAPDQSSEEESEDEGGNEEGEIGDSPEQVSINFVYVITALRNKY